MKNYRFWEQIDVEGTKAFVYQKLGPDWDVYIITVLAGLLIILLLFRRIVRQ